MLFGSAKKHRHRRTKDKRTKCNLKIALRIFRIFRRTRGPNFWIFEHLKLVDAQMEEQEYCKYCGAANPTSTSFCTKCGKAFASASASPLPTLSATNEKKKSHAAPNT